MWYHIRCCYLIRLYKHQCDKLINPPAIACTGSFKGLKCRLYSCCCLGPALSLQRIDSVLSFSFVQHCCIWRKIQWWRILLILDLCLLPFATFQVIIKGEEYSASVAILKSSSWLFLPCSHHLKIFSLFCCCCCCCFHCSNRQAWLFTSCGQSMQHGWSARE